MTIDLETRKSKLETRKEAYGCGLETRKDVGLGIAGCGGSGDGDEKASKILSWNYDCVNTLVSD